MTRCRYSPAIADVICSRIAEGESARAILRTRGMPSRSSMHVWLEKYDDFSRSYAFAMSMRADLLFREILEVANQSPGLLPSGAVDPAEVQHRRLKIWALMWQVGVLKPKKYGRKVTVETGSRTYVQLVQRDAGGSVAASDHHRARVRDGADAQLEAKP